MRYPVTPDGRYFVVKGRLWRCSNPQLDAETRSQQVRALMQARRAVKAALRTQDDKALAQARQQVHAAKVALGERGAVWWTDGSPDYNRCMVHHTPYAEWYASLDLSASSLSVSSPSGDRE
ncbi:MAG: hypothetical protein IGS50_00070 [Synechococcales cyanobacterium C42_A2020_086]|jgi:hypothetical protein|nr:hypothetical protein [Synechococcales cyanobacterium C42_A2020_086]